MRLISFGRMGLAKIRHQPLTCLIQSGPAFGDMKRRNRYQLAAIEPDQCSINQLTHFHHLGESVDIHTCMRPDFGAGCGRQHGLHIDPFG